MKKRCCRSLPRCASCPVRLGAAARRRETPYEAAALVTEILGARPVRRLPPGIAAALAELERARALR